MEADLLRRRPFRQVFCLGHQVICSLVLLPVAIVASHTSILFLFCFILFCMCLYELRVAEYLKKKNLVYTCSPEFLADWRLICYDVAPPGL